MFTGKNEHRGLRELTNALELELYECAEVSFEWRGENTHSFNRLFAVKECAGAPSVLTLAAGAKRCAMQPHTLYFLSAGDRFGFEFHPGTHFFSFHFTSICVYLAKNYFCTPGDWKSGPAKQNGLKVSSSS